MVYLVKSVYVPLICIIYYLFVYIKRLYFYSFNTYDFKFFFYILYILRIFAINYNMEIIIDKYNINYNHITFLNDRFLYFEYLIGRIKDIIIKSNNDMDLIFNFNIVLFNLKKEIEVYLCLNSRFNKEFLMLNDLIFIKYIFENNKKYKPFLGEFYSHIVKRIVLKLNRVFNVNFDIEIKYGFVYKGYKYIPHYLRLLDKLKYESLFYRFLFNMDDLYAFLMLYLDLFNYYVLGLFYYINIGYGKYGDFIYEINNNLLNLIVIKYDYEMSDFSYSFENMNKMLLFSSYFLILEKLIYMLDINWYINQYDINKYGL